MATQIYFPVLKQSNVYGKAGGKIEILDPVSTNYIDVYVYNATNDTYTVVNNPIYLDAEGRSTQTYFVKQLAYFRLYNYLGDFSDPRTDDDSNNWSFVRDWYNSIDVEFGTGDNLDVYGLYGLMDADPALKSVDVVGYWTDDDCEKRTYVWDETCVGEPDAGYVVQSNSTEVGRWILKFDGEYLPSTYYGVYPGHEENINALMTYPDTVGTSEIKTAPGVYFHRGSYNEREATLVTTKKLLLDGDTHFICDIQCNTVDVVGDVNNFPIADFYFIDHTTTAHSSWFRTVEGFYTCNAGKLVFDANNYFVSRVLSRSVTVSNIVLEGSNTLGAITYQNSAYITVSDCTILGEKLWNKDDYVRFAYMAFNDRWFDISLPSNYDFTSHIICRTVSINKLELVNFDNALVYILAKRANGDTTIDLESRILGTVNLANFTDIRNVNATSVSIGNGSTSDITLTNVRTSSLSVAGRYLTLKNCDVTFTMEANIDAMWANDSTVTASYQFSSPSKQYIFKRCYVNISFRRVTDNTSRDAYLEFTDCDFAENCMIESKSLVMTNCTTHNNPIKIYPYKADDKYYMWVKLIGNRFNNSTPVEFTKVDLINGAYQDDVYEILVDWTICDNLFIGNEQGLKCRYWQHRTGSNYGKTFIKWNDSSNNVVYFGNEGKCPDDTAHKVSLTNGSGCESSFYYVELSEDNFITVDKRNPVRIMPDFKQSSFAYHAFSYAINGNGFAVRTRYTGNDNSDFNCAQGFQIYPWAAVWEQVNDGDCFSMAASKWGKVRENDPSYYPWTWRFLSNK